MRIVNDRASKEGKLKGGKKKALIRGLSLVKKLMNRRQCLGSD